MAEPVSQVEVQLGHLCNNRCVFCVSGQLSEQKRAPQLPAQPIQDQIRDARLAGATKITFLGGEPTIQGSFWGHLQFAVDLNFQEIVIFTNGTMTPRQSFRQRVFQVLEALGPDVKKRVIWRFSLQGGAEKAHDATTLNAGSWQRIITSLNELHGTGARLTGNMCVVTSNYESIPDLAEVAARYDFENLHLDMVRPRDSGDRTDLELRAMMAPYTQMAPYFLALENAVDQQLGSDFDLNFGNVPYCTMPEVAHRIHHDGQFTVTVAADGQGTTQSGFNKYQDKRSDKHKPQSCARCAFDTKCSGIFDKYRQFYGDDEFQPVSSAQLWQTDVKGHHFAMLLKPWLDQQIAAGQVRLLRSDEKHNAFELMLPTEDGNWHFILQRAGRAADARAWLTLSSGRFQLQLLGVAPQSAGAAAQLQGWVDNLTAQVGGLALQIEQAHIVQSYQAYAQALRQVSQIAQTLRSTTLAGMRAHAATKTPDQQGIILTFAKDAGQLALTLRVEKNRAGQFKPKFEHEVRGLSADVVAEFNRSLGVALRPSQTSRAQARQI